MMLESPSMKFPAPKDRASKVTHVLTPKGIRKLRKPVTIRVSKPHRPADFKISLS